MAEKNYLWLRFFARTFDALIYIFLFLLLSSFLLNINIYIVLSDVNSKYYSYFVSRVIEFILFICEFYVFVFSIDCLIYYFIGNNLGKMILGLKIVNADTGNKLNLADYSNRTMRQMFSGFGLGIPLLYFITFFIQYNIVFQKNRASYDKKADQSSDDERLNQSFNGEEADLSSDEVKASSSSGEEKVGSSSDNGSDIANKIVRQPIPFLNYIFFFAVYIFLFLSVGSVLCSSVSNLQNIETNNVYIGEKNKSNTTYNTAQSNPKNDLLDVQQLQQAARQGNGYAELKLADSYYSGQGVQQNYQMASYWYNEAANQGIAAAQFNLGYMYHYGLGCPTNYQLAMNWYSLAAKQGNSDAQTNIGFMYDKGQGVAQDHKTAAMWYTAAANQGNASAQYNLGVLYYNGYGVPQNKNEAMKLFNLAALQGHIDAKNFLKEAY